mgnify:CR=1 FL=1
MDLFKYLSFYTGRNPIKNFEGFDVFSNLKNLIFQSIGVNEVPKEVYNCIHLTHLNITQNSIVTISDEIRNLTKLQILRL